MVHVQVLGTTVLLSHSPQEQSYILLSSVYTDFFFFFFFPRGENEENDI